MAGPFSLTITDARGERRVLIGPQAIMEWRRAEPFRAAALDMLLERLERTIRRAPISVLVAEQAGAYLSVGICPACGYDILGIPATDGLTVCPECAAPWRVPSAR